MILPEKGNLLIANPFLKDHNFLRTVVFLCEHSDIGSLGFVLNRLLTQKLGHFLTELEAFDINLFYGGPVENNTIHFLHQYPDIIDGGQQVLDNLYWGGNFESLVANIQGGNLDLNKIKFFIGYSGWSDGQLENEMNEKSWLTVKATRNLIFHNKPEDIWKNSLKHMGGDYEMMINFPLDPQFN